MAMKVLSGTLAIEFDDAPCEANKKRHGHTSHLVSFSASDPVPVCAHCRMEFPGLQYVETEAEAAA